MSNTLTERLLSSSPKASWLNMVALTVLLALGGSGCERIPDPQVTSGHLDTTTGIHQAGIAKIIESLNSGLSHYDNTDSTNTINLGFRGNGTGMNIGNEHDPLVYDSEIDLSIKAGDTVYIDLNHANGVETIETKAEMMRDYSNPRRIGATEAGIDICDSAKVTGRATAIVQAVWEKKASDIDRIYFGNQPEIKKLLEVQESK